jgi:hypothetical protein
MKNSTDELPGVPSQHEGSKKDIDHTVRAADDNDARKLFMIARNRLVDVNHWADISKPVTATFKLTDAQGNVLNRTAEKGDFFRIDLPAPGPNEGEGYDWVRIETIEEQGRPDEEVERIVIQVRPTPAPINDRENVAHFFDERATSSFMVERKGTEVTAAVFGRNEVPNTSTSNVVDKVRNAMVGTSAILGFSNVQWKNLVKGLIEGK